MDYLASFQLLPLRFAGNQLIVNVPSPETVADRALLLYRLDIYKPLAFQSGNYDIFESLRGREAPPVIESGIAFSEGCNFDLSEFVWGLLSPSPPKADQNTITMQALATMPIYWEKWVEPYESTTENTSSIQYLLRAKLEKTQFPSWKEQFFTEYLAETRSFLTWQPKTDKIVDRNQPEFLSYLVHHDPAPSKLRVRVDLEFSDGTRSLETLTPIELTKVYNYTLYTIPVGFKALGLDIIEATTEKEIFAYKVWISDQALFQLTEERRYIVNNDFQPYVRHLVFLNSLGGWDTVRFFGVSSEQIQTASTTFQRQLEANYTAGSEEMFVTNISGDRKLTLNTGYLPDRQWLRYLEEIIWAEKIFVNSDEGLIPLILGQNTYDSPNDEEDFAGRTFVFKPSKNDIAYSGLPVAPIINNATRPTAWVGAGAYCIVDEKGIRSSYQSYSFLELRYTDGDMERVAGTARKANTPETEGYIAPAISITCQVTPYLNVEISRNGTFQKNDCTSGLFGTTATIVVPAATHGSEVSQVQAQARAEATWSNLNTQATANAIGSCVLLYKSVAISRLSTYTRNSCSGGLYGSKWTVIVLAGAYTSEISQADADNQATAYANSIDTQTNANLYGSCGWGNVAASRNSTYKKSTCTGGMVGTTWLISVVANTFFSTISQSDANAQASADMNTRDTQANADLYGTCRFENTCISKTTSYLIQSGANVGKPVTIWYSRNVFQSLISQADADAKVTAHFNANYNTQAIVNGYYNVSRDDADYCTWGMSGQITIQVRN